MHLLVFRQFCFSSLKHSCNFYLGDEEDDSDGADINDHAYRSASKSDQSHLIVWQIPLPSPNAVSNL